ncbi:MAG: glutamate-5-semialdehyde dehydrogenase [Phenylobacterium zucineum]|nr:MAG: glutamate-5-semialdehyde dehydrogenase [Phenylobacterium zucineum]
MLIPFSGDRFTRVSPELAKAFRPGDQLMVVQDTGDLLHIPADTQTLAHQAVTEAQGAFQQMAAVSEGQITAFFDRFARALGNDLIWAAIAEANRQDVARALERGRSTTRLLADANMRRDMIAGLRVWRNQTSPRNAVIERIAHAGWAVEQVKAPLGVVGFVFEGRPNVFADATGVIRGGNTVVFRIGSDALGTAQAIVQHALDPALAVAGLPAGAARLVVSPEHAAGWALFSDKRLALAVARGSGPAVAQLGAIARQTGIPVSLHGTGGAWMVADASADADRFFASVYHSLDRKVCNTLNVCAIVRTRADDLVPRFLEALAQAGARRAGFKLHVWGAQDKISVPHTQLAETDLATEWEWEDKPEVTLAIVDDLDHAITLFNRYSPRFGASLIAEDAAAQAHFFANLDAPFVGDGFTRWIDGQYALDRPELGLANWENGRLFARGGVLAGDGVYTIRTRVRQSDQHLDRTPDTAKSF